MVIQLPPGDYVTAYIAKLQAQEHWSARRKRRRFRIQYGLDRPIYVQYVKWMGLMLHGNFGMAMEYNRPVREVIGDRMTLTIIVSVAAVLFIWALALPIGIYSAVNQYSILDYFFTFIGFIGIAVPNFMLALIILYVSYQIPPRGKYWRALFARHAARAVGMGENQGPHSALATARCGSGLGGHGRSGTHHARQFAR